MTAPSRIPHGEAVRNAVRVEWMRLECLADLVHARSWVGAHGLQTHIAAGRALLAWDDGPTLLTAVLGQVLAYNPGSGEFTVWDAHRFDEAHSRVGA